MLARFGKQIDELIREVCVCRRGTPFHGQDFLATFDNIGIPRDILVIQFNPPEQRDASQETPRE
jgi:hypothetical protein